MSGAKRITVGEGEWRRAQRARQQLAQVQANLPTVLADERRRMERELNRVHSQVSARQDRVEGRLKKLSQHTKDLERRTDERLRAQARRLSEVRDEAHAAIAEQGRLLRAELDRESEARRREIKALDSRVGELRDESDRAAQAALATFQDAVTVHDVIRDELPHERFAPGRLDRLRVRLDVARANLESQAPGFALTQVQDVYLDLSELRAEVARLDQEWRAAQAVAVATLGAVAERVAANATRPVVDEEGRELDGGSLDVDFWTDGGLTELRAEIERLTGEAAAPDSPCTVETLRAIVEERAPQYGERLDELVERASGRLFASQRRVNVAHQIATRLRANGYQVGTGPDRPTYAGEDFRDAFFAKLRHPDDSEIVVEVAPSGDEDMTVRILSYENAPSDHERRERVRAVGDALRTDGLDVGEAVDEGGEPDRSYRDLDRIRRERTRERAAEGRVRDRGRQGHGS
ncbi:hypothetical protein [Actinomadura rugatobispora]|uniref:Uncharacterized protein n=1 Tax=Actinomadura rugatobispora TaxID=1994 RepID=A0ABW1A0T8_9ACTN|nr:hypothetical protein GCM10010200_049610 [Actinomadura rugatobispora]